MRDLICGRHPWVGDRYLGGPRTMVLAESHYGSPEEDHPHYTEEVIRYHVMQKDRPDQRGIFARVGHLLRALPPKVGISADGLRDVFDEVVFANYVQDMMPTRHHRPTPAQFREGAPALQAILDRYQPERILVVGAATWKYLPAPARRDQLVLSDGRIADRRWYRAAGRILPAMPIWHPATPHPWQVERWAPVVEALLGCRSRADDVD